MTGIWKIVFGLAGCAATAHAAVSWIEVRERSDVLDGRAFGAAGAYERLVGKAHFAVDPALAANRAVADIGKAPRNAEGKVEFSADLYVLKPRDPRLGNGAALYQVSNRGGKGMLSTFSFGSSAADPRQPADFGDGYLMERGYTLVWLGWQFDVPHEAGRMRLYTPAAAGVTGLVRSEIVLDTRKETASLADREHVPYLVRNPDDASLRLTVRDRATGPRSEVPRSQWRIVQGSRIALTGGFEPGRLYELVYTAENPAIAGLGPAAVRDLISFLKYGGNPLTMLGDHARYMKRAYGFGISQSGRFLRAFVYHGFNQDEKGRKVFDGLMAHVAGGGRGSFNQRFAQPSRDGASHFNTLYPTDIFPFTDLEQRDPETGLTDGLLSHTPPAAAPKIFYTNSSYEYYGRAASLIHTTVDGKRDAPLAPTTRVYFFAGSQHGPASMPPRQGTARHLPNPNPFTLSLRALLEAMDRWVRDGTEPPPSRYPRIDAGQLTAVEGLKFPRIPKVEPPRRIHLAYRADYGPEFRSAGIATVEPPRLGEAFPVLVPQVDGDGNETSGIRNPFVQWPLGTLAGWNLRTAAIGAPDELYTLTGSFLPFARTRAERTASGDPRPSVEERYSGKAEYLERISAAARTLVEAGFLLDRDVARLAGQAAEHWDWLAGR